jgi:glycogen debranching enzyme
VPVEDVIKVEDRYYILATSSRAADRNRVLKHGDTFAVFDRVGDIVPIELGEEGIYHEGTRFLSRLALRLGTSRPLLLSSTVKEDNDILAVDLTNPDIARDGTMVLPRGTLHVLRSKFVWDGTCYEGIRISNYSMGPAALSLTLEFDADFADIFEVRGMLRAHRGQRLAPTVEGSTVVLAYRGLDAVLRRTIVECSPVPQALSADSVRFDLQLKPQASTRVLVTVSCEREGARHRRLPYDGAVNAVTRAFTLARGDVCEITSSNEQFDRWMARSRADLHMMITETEAGPYPYAGVPWFSTPFGRDGIITALQLLWADPTVARGVLGYLAATQATAVVPEQDAEPGKILHETRGGEMAALGEVPFGRYYGSVDATPLFVMLAGAYYDRTADRPFIESIWGHIERALAWLDGYGDPDGDGFVEYWRRSPKGLEQQGWKDSHDSVFHADGSLADGPIALCEVQGYAYAARLSAARLATALGREPMAQALTERAAALRAEFERRFWCEDLGTYALALDGRKQPCRVRTSNPGHCLFTRIASEAHARRVADTVFSADMFSGWGVRTVAASEVRYNPMSYHDGSVWPHDNALLAAGLGRYQMTDRAARLLAAFFDASGFFDLSRLPELFCGFARRGGEGPTLYPVACAPQSWAAGAAFMFLQGALGLSIRSAERRIYLFRPNLPEFLQAIEIKNLRVGDASVDLLLERTVHHVGVNVLRREGTVDIVSMT